MAVTAQDSPTIIDGDNTYLIEDRQLFEAMVTATQHALDQHSEADLLTTPYDRLVAQLRHVVRDVLRKAETERFSRVKPRLFDRALRAYIAREVGKRQGLAFEAQLAAEYGPLEQSDTTPCHTRYKTINGVSIVEIDAGDEGDAAKRV